MKLIQSLIYEILAYVEDHQEPGPYEVPKNLGDYSVDQVNYHIQMCEDAGFIEDNGRAEIGLGGKSHYTHIGELTWKGHQELASLRK